MATIFRVPPWSGITRWDDPMAFCVLRYKTRPSPVPNKAPSVRATSMTSSMAAWARMTCESAASTR